MYRQSLESAKMEEIKKMPGESQEQFLTRISSLPVVTTALGQLCTFYSRTKESNSVLKYTLETAESGAKIAMTKAQPWALPALSKFEKPIGAINAIACNQLDKLEKNYPIITRPADQILDETLVLYKNTLKPSVDKVVAAKEYSVEKVSGVQDYTKSTIDGVKGYGYEKMESTKGTISSVKDYGVEKISGAVQYGTQTAAGALQSPYGQVLVQKVDGALDVTNRYVDYYLPEEETSGEEKAEVDAVEESNGFTKAVSISSKVRTRMYRRAIRELQRVQLRSKETLEKFGFTVDLIQYAKDQMDGVKGRATATGAKVCDLWTEINKSEDQVVEEPTGEVDAGTLQRRALVTARHLTARLKGMIGYMGTTVSVLPTTFQEKVTQAREISDHLYNVFSTTELKVTDIPQVVLDQTKAQITNLQASLNQLSEYVLDNEKFDWITPDDPLDLGCVELDDHSDNNVKSAPSYVPARPASPIDGTES